MHDDGYPQGGGQSRMPDYQTVEKQRPVETLRDGNLKASIWRNDSENGPYYSTTFARTWRDDQGQFHDSQSYSGTDLLKLQELSRQAYVRSGELRREHTLEHAQDRGKVQMDKTAFRQRRADDGKAPERERNR